jgi:outer membrane protein OmpA-like peptidoglycan-associated protein
MGAASDAGGGMKKLAPWLLLALAAIVGWMMMRSCNKEQAKPVVQEAAKVVDTTAKKAVEAVSNLFEKALSTGFKISAPKDGIEGQLVSFIEDANRPVDKTTWFNFDRLLFETGKATLKPESQEQLNNVAQIMKAFPAVELKIGGYTDNVGKAASNMKLSTDRANATMAELVKLGVEANRMKAEGYGDQHPVASNDTEEGRAQNRRIALRVTKK